MFASLVVGGRDGAHHAAFGVEDLEFHVRGIAVEAVGPLRLTAFQRRHIGLGANFLADQTDGRGHARTGVRDQLLEKVVGQELLLHARHLHQLLGELGGVHR